MSNDLLPLTVLSALAPSSDPTESSSVPAEDGVRQIPIETSQGTFQVWTRRVGESPSMKVLLLHGGPGATHEYLLAFEDYLPASGIEFYFYDQLGSAFSDQPDNPELWEITRFVEEVEQVRLALGLDSDNFYLYGHSWGGILAIEYALKYQEHLKGMIISNVMASIPAYNRYSQEVHMQAIDPEILDEIKGYEKAEDYTNSRYSDLLMEHHYIHRVLRMPADQWPDEVNRAFAAINPLIYIPMQGPSELGASGKLENWDRTNDLEKISVPTLTIGARYGTMDPVHIEWMASAVQDGRYLGCPEGGHLTMYDDPECYFEGLIRFVRDIDAR